jgi:Holliday junction DNA helicase RuvB
MDFTDFIGQDGPKENLRLLINAAKRGRKFPHIGLFGPAGSGKTTLAEIICEELDAELIYINGAAVTSPVVFRKPIARAVQQNGKDKQYIIVIDECHCLPSKVQNNLLSVTEEPAILCTPVERKTKLPNGSFLQKGDILKEKLPENVSFIFATTDKGKINGPLSSRLHPVDLDEYTVEHKETVVKQSLNKHSVTLEEDDFTLIGSIGKSMRHIKKLCDRIVDYAVGQDRCVLDHADVLRIIDILGINELGCDKNDQRYLDYVKERGPVSLSNIARYMNVEEKEVKEKIEPFLIRKEWVEITSKGRVITNSGFIQVFGEQHPDTVDDLMQFVMSD